MAPGYDDLIALVGAAASDPRMVLLEGAHAVKHATRFGAQLVGAVTPDRAKIEALLADLAPDVQLPELTIEVGRDVWLQLTAKRRLPSPIVAVAHRPDVSADDVLAATGRVVLLEQPRNPGNVGAVIRVAAAAGAGGVLVCGHTDPWSAMCIRGGAGLQYALPVARSDGFPRTSRQIVAIDPAGRELGSEAIEDDAVVVFGTERGGLSAQAQQRADLTIRIPMRSNVSSLNLATAVAVILYAYR
ncbi:MAG: TrmH family RNA methyltransferase [Nitriliruptoraceae bacterium]